MMRSEDAPVEQLWYTWSDIGIDFIRMGYRIRAASPGLSDPRSARVQELERYQRYVLPEAVERAQRLSGNRNDEIDPRVAPVSLALINTGQERALVHKVYIGRDGIGRSGAYFTHLLANLSPAFSPYDAISLWRSSFWRTSDDRGQSNRHDTHLESLSLAVLRKQQGEHKMNRLSDSVIRMYLPYILEAYLTKSLLLEGRRGQSQRAHQLYIVGPDDLVASLISALVRSLPANLCKDMTFSTYEHDVNQASTEIVGTCWLSGQEKDPAVRELLPADYYREKLAINCYTGECSQLENHPLVRNHPLATQFAQDATEYFLTGSPGEFQDLLDAVKMEPSLTVRMVLELYASDFSRVQAPTAPSQKDIELALTPRSPADYERAARRLTRPSYQEKLLSLVLTEPGWWPKHREAIIHLREYSSQLPALAQALHTIATRQAFAVIKRVIQQGAANKEKPAQAIPEAAIAFELMVDLMSCIKPPEREPDVWHHLLQSLLTIPSVLTFFDQHWQAYTQIMQIWALALSPVKGNNELISPLLVIPWSRFGTMLTLPLPFDWIEIAAKSLVLAKSTPPPDREIIDDLAQHYHPNIQQLLEHLAQDEARWPTAMALFNVLEVGNYQAKPQLFLTLLDSPMGSDGNAVRALLQFARLTQEEMVLFLERYGPRYLLNKKIESTILDLFGELARNNWQQEKMRILFGWLSSSDLTSWLKTPPESSRNLSAVLSAATLTGPGESEEFFRRFGREYIRLYPGSRILLDLFDRYVQSGGAMRLSLLVSWLDATTGPKTMERLLEIARLSPVEKREVLLRYGIRHLTSYPQSKVLSGYIQEFLDDLHTADSSLFRTRAAAGESSEVEQLLSFLVSQKLPSSADTILLSHWYNAARFVRNPDILTAEWEPIATSIDWLLTSNTAQEPMSTGLIQEIALACLRDEQRLAERVHDLSGILSPQNTSKLLYSIAINAREGMRLGSFKTTLLESSVLLAFRSKNLMESEPGQEAFVKRFLDILLQDTDQKTLKRLSERARQWPSKSLQAEWQHYLSQRMDSAEPDSPTSFLKIVRPFLRTHKRNREVD